MSLVTHAQAVISAVHESAPHESEDMFGEHVSENVGEQLHHTAFHPMLHHAGHSTAVLMVALGIFTILAIGLLVGIVTAVTDEKIEGCTA